MTPGDVSTCRPTQTGVHLPERLANESPPWGNLEVYGDRLVDGLSMAGMAGPHILIVESSETLAIIEGLAGFQ